MIAGSAKAIGWLVEAGDPEAFAAALGEALAMPARARAQMGQRARRHVSEHFSLARMRRATLEVYDELLGSDLAGALGSAAAAKHSR